MTTALLSADAEIAHTERVRLERDLHDGAQQRLVALSLQLALLSRRLPPESRPLLDAARGELATALSELRELARGICPTALNHGLAAALESLVVRAPVPVRLRVDATHGAAPAIEKAAYYVICEALTNVARHAEAASAAVDVTCRGRRLIVEVADDGIGGADAAGGSGLHGLAGRVRALGGRLSVISPAGGGTLLRAEIPCDQGPG
jgi:signal transduction histidine kinase